MNMAKVTYINDDESFTSSPPSYSDSDRLRFESQVKPTSKSPSKVQFLKGFENTISRGRPELSSVSDKNSVSSSLPNSSARVNLLKGMEHVVTSRPAMAEIPLRSEQENLDVEESPEVEEQAEKRDTWGRKAEFILASVGLAVGLGNVWRFPYLCQRNGGGAFLIPYVIFMFIEGIPLMILEFSIGQKMRKTAVSVWKDIHPALFGVGIGCIVVSLLLCIYYVIVIAWCLFYLFISMRKHLPWKIDELCSNSSEFSALKIQRDYWKTNSSYYKDRLINMNVSDVNYNSTSYLAHYAATMYNSTQYNITNFPDCCVIDPPQWYFYSEVLEISSDIEDYSHGVNLKILGCLILAWVVVYFCVVKGIKSSGKVVYFTATFPYIILIILFFRGVTLEGAAQGLKTFIYPDLDRLKDVKVWKDAATQMFFTLSLGFGALIAFASYMPYKNQCINDAYTVVFINCGTSIFAGVVVFSILGYRELKTGIKAADVGSGPGLAFMAFSDALLQLDLSPFWAVMFFFMLILLGIDSEFGTLEAAIGPMMELGLFPKKWRKEFCTAIAAVILFLIGISMATGNGFYVFQIFDDYCATLPLLIIALFQCIGVSWIYGNDRFADDIEDMTGKRPWMGWLICWKYISPLALLIVLIATIIDLCKGSAAYNVFVGCEQAPYSPEKYPGSESWTAKEPYPAWGQFLVAFVILASSLPILIFLVIKWPRNWLQSFRKTFSSGLHNYHPDPGVGDVRNLR